MLLLCIIEFMNKSQLILLKLFWGLKEYILKYDYVLSSFCSLIFCKPEEAQLTTKEENGMGEDLCDYCI